MQYETDDSRYSKYECYKLLKTLKRNIMLRLNENVCGALNWSFYFIPKRCNEIEIRWLRKIILTTETWNHVFQTSLQWFQPGRWIYCPIWNIRLLFCFAFIIINPSFITCYKNIDIRLESFRSSSTQASFWAWVRLCGIQYTYTIL